MFWPLKPRPMPTIAQREALEVAGLVEAVGGLEAQLSGLRTQLRAISEEKSVRELEIAEIRGRYTQLVARLTGALDRQARRDGAPPEVRSDLESIRKRLGR